MAKRQTKIAIVTDSVANIPGELAEKYDIRVVPLYVNVDGVSYKEELEISPRKIFDSLLSGSQVKSSTPTIKDFMDTYKEIQDKDDPDMIYSIHLSSVLSGTINSASAAAESLKDLNIKIVDSRIAAIGEGFIALAAATAAKRGDSPEQIDRLLEDIMAQNYFYATFDNFEYIVKGGRAPFLAGFVKKVMLLKAIIGFDNTGSLGLKKFCMNKSSSIKTLFDLVKKDIISSGMESCLIGICYGIDDGSAEKLKKMVEEDADINASGIVMTRMTSVMAAHTGPGIWGISACPSFVSSL
jgi:DegV family protein with EDD domain